MITPQIIHAEPEHPSLLNDMSGVPEDMRNHYAYQHHQPPPPPMKYKSEPDYRPSALPIKYKTEPEYQPIPPPAESSTPLLGGKKPKKEVDSSKAYKCPLCEYSFNRRDHLTRHSLVHSKLKPYHCTFCSKDFTRNDHLRRHQQRVHGEETAAAASLTDITQRFICQECKAIFTSSGHLRVHMENKHHSDFSDFMSHPPSHDQTMRKIQSSDTAYVVVDGKKRPVCQLCNKSFSKKDHLSRHMNNLHAGINGATFSEHFAPEQSYNCSLCGKRFSRPEFLRRHLDDAHNHASQMEILNQLNPNNPYNNGQGHGSGLDPMFPVPPPHMSSMFGVANFENTPAPPPQQPKPVKAPTALKTHNCSICSKNFTRRYHLTRHQKSLHGGVFEAPQ